MLRLSKSQNNFCQTSWILGEFVFCTKDVHRSELSSSGGLEEDGLGPAANSPNDATPGELLGIRNQAETVFKPAYGCLVDSLVVWLVVWLFCYVLFGCLHSRTRKG